MKQMGDFQLFIWKAKTEIWLNVLGVNTDLLEGLFLSRFILTSWDQVAQETRTQLKGHREAAG